MGLEWSFFDLIYDLNSIKITLRITIGNSPPSEPKPIQSILLYTYRSKINGHTALVSLSTPVILTPSLLSHSYAQSQIKMQVLLSASIAQMVKALECNLKVVSSNPEGGKFFSNTFLIG